MTVFMVTPHLAILPAPVSVSPWPVVNLRHRVRACRAKRRWPSLPEAGEYALVANSLDTTDTQAVARAAERIDGSVASICCSTPAPANT
ncbi:hypothetical protein DSL92_01050 [Billgrantia gudaonensis]|uniref:Uncharacterized protein n=1 Tax=Billgrantia gudaonensis TaxID=376427 RepID=A0A432JKP0_9GAMM|nr:hypothetical protein DSL92_01050 [Halomonas gudaonensis]